MFSIETEQGVAQAIIRSVINFKRDPWPKVSDNVKDLVKKMLEPNPKSRLTAQQVLGNVTLYRYLLWLKVRFLNNVLANLLVSRLQNTPGYLT